jgi:hypothetical protein
MPTLEEISRSAERYAFIDQLPTEQKTDALRAERRAIVAELFICDALRTAYFCQQLLSWCHADAHHRSAVLTALTNRLNDYGSNQ